MHGGTRRASGGALSCSSHHIRGWGGDEGPFEHIHGNTVMVPHLMHWHGGDDINRQGAMAARDVTVEKCGFSLVDIEILGGMDTHSQSIEMCYTCSSHELHD